MLSIIDKMHGQFRDGRSCDRLSDADALRLSVRDNLQRILTSKRGMQIYAPLFGISDAAGFYRSALQNGDDLRKQIQENVDQYEPRIQHARTAAVELNASKAQLIFRITGSLTGSRVHYLALFSPDGHCQVELG